MARPVSTPFPEEEKSILFTFLLYIIKLLTLSYYNTSPALAIASNATVLCPPPTSFFLSASLLSVSTSYSFSPRDHVLHALSSTVTTSPSLIPFFFFFSLFLLVSYLRELSSPSRNSPISRNLSLSTLSIFRSRAPAIDDRPSWILPALPGAYLAIEIGL